MTLTLFDLEQPAPARPAPPPRRQRPHTHPSRPRRTNQAHDCQPACIVCGHAEGDGYCTPRCAVMCVHAAQHGRAEVCLITTRVQARLVAGLPGATPGRRLAVVDSCPFCGRIHWHAAAYGIRYRIARCGRPYLVALDRPRAVPAAEHTAEHQHAATRGADLARQLLARKDRT